MRDSHKSSPVVHQTGRLLVFLPLLVLYVHPGLGSTNRVNLFPKLHAGQTLSYQISYHSDKQVNTQSSVIAATVPDSAKVDVRALLRLEILRVEPKGERALIHARTRFEVLDSYAHSKIPNTEPAAPHVQREDPGGKSVEFTILPQGGIDQVNGLDDLLPEQQQAWQEWASRFALATAVPMDGMKIAQKWKSEESEKSPSPIARLLWLRESTYVRDEPCRAMQMTAQGDLADSGAESDTCAVILTTAALKQESSARNATPEDFKLHELRTSGTARGTNRIITYISLTTGLIVRASEEANQQMDVTVAKTDGSNRVRYGVNAKSRSEILLVSETPLSNP
jgi:hypothetical protein